MLGSGSSVSEGLIWYGIYKEINYRVIVKFNFYLFKIKEYVLRCLWSIN